MNRARPISGILILLVIVVLTSCTAVDRGMQEKNYPTWPAAPAKPRIKLTNIFSVPNDLNIVKGFWQKFADFFLGSEVVNMVRPMNIVKDSDDRIYVSDPGAHGIHLFDLKEHEYKLIKLKDQRDMLSPIAMTVSATDVLYITDSKSAVVYKYNNGDDFASQIELEEGLEQPTGILIDAKTEDLFIVDTKRHQILVYDATGDYIRVIGKRGKGNGEFNYPTMMSWDKDGNILVTDSLNFRIQQFNKNGRYIKQFGKVGDSSGYQSRPKGIATDKDNNIYVVDALFHTIQIFDPSGNYLLSVGEQGHTPGKFWLPSGIYIDKKQKIYVADSHNQRVQVFELIETSQ